MPIASVEVLTITCDNPDCPGNELDPATRTGWTFVTSEVSGATNDDGVPTPQAYRVFCSADCVSAFAASVGAGTRTWASP
jgi:hypothetical protein